MTGYLAFFKSYYTTSVQPRSFVQHARTHGFVAAV
jgi:hypothetical protein